MARSAHLLGSLVACAALSGCWFELGPLASGGQGGQGGSGAAAGSGGQGATAGAGGLGGGGASGLGGGGAGPCEAGLACDTGLPSDGCDVGELSCLPDGSAACVPTSTSCACEAATFGDGLYLFCADEAPFHPLRCGDQYHPVTIDSEAEGDFVHASAGALVGGPVFLGLHQTPGAAEPLEGFDWVVASTTGYVRWLPGQPNDLDGEDCATIGQASAGGGPEWVDYACQAELGVVCELGPPGLDTTGWWDAAWPYRLRVELSAGGLSESDVPLLITIPGSVAGIADFSPEAADVRVVAPDGALLDHDVDDWSIAADTLWLWVRVPTLDASLDHLDVYFGNYSAPSSADPAAVWQGYGGVWHFSDGGFDSSENGLDAITPVSSLLVDDGMVSDALGLDGSTAVLLPKSPELEVAAGDGISIELMLRRDDAVSSGMVLSNESCCQGYRIRSEPGSLVEAGFGVADCCVGPPNTEFSIDYTADTTWHHVVWVLDRAAHAHLVWVDGAPADLASMPQGSFSFPQLRLGVGVAEDGTPASIDELRIARRVLTSGEIDARWRSVNGFLVTGLTLEALTEN